jgi:hypothetical protein
MSRWLWVDVSALPFVSRGRHAHEGVSNETKTLAAACSSWTKYHTIIAAQAIGLPFG